jgi:hypothetical protein
VSEVIYMAKLDLDAVESMDWTVVAQKAILELNDKGVIEFLKENWEEHFSRPDSLLTDKQRRFILGLTEYSGENARQQRYQMRERIRRRYENGLMDLSLLALLDQNSKEAISDRVGREGFVSAAADLLEFIYITTGDREILSDAVSRAIFESETENRTLGVSNAKPQDVSVEISVEYEPDYESIYTKYETEGMDSLTPREVGFLIKDSRLDPSDIQDYYDERDSVPDNHLFDGVERSRSDSTGDDGNC